MIKTVKPFTFIPYNAISFSSIWSFPKIQIFLNTQILLKPVSFINLIQAVPFPDDRKQEAKDSFMECAEAESLTLDEIPKHSDLKQV